jgi:glutathione S-transferase
MKLFLNTASPYARLIRMLVIEAALETETEFLLVDPWNVTDELLNVNPAAKIPALSLEDGTHLIESACIADYLIARSGMASLAPLAYPDALARLAILGLSRAAIDCSFGAVIQQRFASNSPLVDRWLGALPRIAQKIDRLYAERKPSPDCDQGDLTVAVAFDYVDFRLPQVDWRKKNTHLVKRLSAITQRTSFKTTRPA